MKSNLLIHIVTVCSITETNFFFPALLRQERRLTSGTKEQLLISITRLRADMRLYAFARLFYSFRVTEILPSGFLVDLADIIIPVPKYENNHIRQEATLFS